MKVWRFSPLGSPVLLGVLPRGLSCFKRDPRLERWLGPAELSEVESLRPGSRREDWLDGRWCAKRTLGSLGDSPLAWEILSRDSAGQGCPPLVRHHGEQTSISLSISHSPRLAVTAMSAEPGESVGIDVVDQQACSPGFEELWFDPHERALLRDQGVSPLRGWAIKEAAFKAARLDQSFQPRQVIIRQRQGKLFGVEIQTELGACWLEARVTQGRKWCFAIARRTVTEFSRQVA